MKNTGERFIPGLTEKRIRDDHFARYEFALSYCKGRKVLDIACGTGYGTSILSKGAKNVIGVDISEDAISFARKNFKEYNNSFVKDDILNYTSKETFDVICSFETIEHVKEYKKVIKKYWTLLKESGILILSSPNRVLTSPKAESIDDKPQNPFHIREFIPAELSKDLGENGFKNIQFYGQRQQLFFNNKIFNKVYNRLFRPSSSSSPVVSKIDGNKVPRYFIIVCQK